MTALNWITTEAKKLKKKYPNKEWKQLVVQASAIYASKHKGKRPIGKKHKVSGVKKVATKKSYHKDTKSHNVNIRVMSGLVTNYKPGKIGALPVGFTGNILGLKFRIYIQHELDGSVVAQIVEDSPNGYLIAEVNGSTANITRDSEKLYSKVPEKPRDTRDQNEVKNRIKKFISQLSKDVREYNSGKVTKKRTGGKLTIKTDSKATTKEKIKNVLRTDKKRLKYGYTVVPGRVMNGISKKIKFIF